MIGFQKLPRGMTRKPKQLSDKLSIKNIPIQFIASTEKVEMDEYLLEQNVQNLHQAYSTSPGSGTLYDILKEGREIKEIIKTEGLKYKELDTPTHQFLDHLKCEDGILNCCPSSITLTEWQDVLQKTKERKS